MGMIINPYRFAVANTPPACISDGNTVGWYIADDLTTITKDGDNLVAQWNDKLGSGHDFKQANDTNKPTWSADGITFDGSDNFMITDAFTYTYPQFVYMVLKQITWTNLDTFYCEGTGGERPNFLQSTSTPRLKMYDGGTSLNNDTATVGVFQIIRCLHERYITTSKPSRIQVNNLTATTGNLNSSNWSGIAFAYNPSYGRYCNFIAKEFIFRKVNDNSTDETAIYNYLATKYSIS